MNKPESKKETKKKRSTNFNEADECVTLHFAVIQSDISWSVEQTK